MSEQSYDYAKLARMLTCAKCRHSARQHAEDEWGAPYGCDEQGCQCLSFVSVEDARATR